MGKNGRLGIFLADRRANVTVMAALCTPIFLVLAAFAVDEGSLYAEQRALQNLADLAAITAAAHPDNAPTAVLTTLSDNGLTATLETGAPQQGYVEVLAGEAGKVSVTGGHYANAADVSPDRRFVPGAGPVNAFQVKVSRAGTRYFASTLMAVPVLGASAVGYAAPEAAFTVGSRLASLDGGIANAVLGALLGSEVSLSVMDYRALLDARVGVLDVLDGMASSLHLTAATYADVLDTSAAFPAFLEAMAAAPGLDKTAAAALRKAGRSADKRASISLRALFDLGASATLPLGTRSGGIAATANAMQLLNAAAAVGNGTHQVEAELGAALPGILDAKLVLAVGERARSAPWMVVGEKDDVVRTAQTRLLLRVQVGGPGGALGATVTLPLYAELAFAEAQLTEIRCTAGQIKPTRVVVSARPGIAELRIADIDPLKLDDLSRAPLFAPAPLVATRLVKVSGSATISVADPSPTRLSFSTAEIEAHTIKTASTRTLLASPVGSLLEGLTLKVEAGGIGIGLPSLGLEALLSRALADAAEPIDTLFFSVLATLGVSLGQADVWIDGAACNRSVLVQ